MKIGGSFAFFAMLAACGDSSPGTVAQDASDGGPDLGADSATATADDAADSVTPADATDAVAPDAVATDAAATDAAATDAAAADADTSTPTIDPYDRSLVHEVVITMEVAAWDSLRHETRTLFDVLGPDCLESPPVDPFDWYHADVSVDGVALGDVGLTKKGFLGSLSTERPAMRVETDHWVDGQELGGRSHLTLNNGLQDPGRMRQCLAYDVFAAAGVPAPRCSFAHVSVNGADLGLYVNVEPVKKPFLRDHFGEDSGQLWEGAISDFRDGWLGTFDAKNDAVSNSTAPLAAVTTALAAPDDQVLAALDQVIDLDAFFTFWAAEVLVAHWDGYAGNTNNFFVYLHSDGRLRFVPWGVDGTFVDLTSRAGPQSSPTSVLAVGALAHRLYALPAGRARYVAELRRLLADAWHESAMLGDIDAWYALTRSSREPGSADAGAAAVAELKAYVQARRAAIEAELASPPDWPDPLRAELCMHDGGTVTGSFSTTWDTLAIDNLFQTGTGTLGVVSTSLPPLTFAEIGSKAGVDAVGAPGVTQYVLAAHVVNAGYVIILFQSTEPVAPGPLAIDHLTTDGFVYYLQQPDPAQFIGILGDGDLVLEQADATPGSPVKGSFALTLFML